MVCLKCNKCGAFIRDRGARFCHKCGAPLSRTPNLEWMRIQRESSSVANRIIELEEELGREKQKLTKINKEKKRLDTEKKKLDEENKELKSELSKEKKNKLKSLLFYGFAVICIIILYFLIFYYEEV
ncbi:MAG: zinc-ribbon domain-containing protein [Mediterranea sp.]|jgi:septal ring factor EnvC (AmiA/AmiB activator)|nr:zinc-ribbon domain-containing protein [Mediterranea sp.]